MTTTLRDLREVELDQLFEWERDHAAVEMAAFTRADPSDRHAFDAHYDSIRRDSRVLMRAIDDGSGLVGTIASFMMEGAREITCWIDPTRRIARRPVLLVGGFEPADCPAVAVTALVATSLSSTTRVR